MEEISSDAPLANNWGDVFNILKSKEIEMRYRIPVPENSGSPYSKKLTNIKN